MMKRQGLIAGMRIFAMSVAILSASVRAQTPPMTFTALQPLESGMWQLDSPGRPAQFLCVTDPTVLFQIVHAGRACSRFVIANEATRATVHYSCNAAGWGRTTIRVETARLVQIQTQGIKQNRPFEFKVEARRVGGCQAAASPQK